MTLKSHSSGSWNMWRRNSGLRPARWGSLFGAAARQAASICKIDGAWGTPATAGTDGRDAIIYSNTPHHRGPLSRLPQGGNESFIDGSARWIKFDRMLFLTTWDTQNRIYYFFQEDLPPRIQTVIARLRAGP
jgi:hypothetical protein